MSDSKMNLNPLFQGCPDTVPGLPKAESYVFSYWKPTQTPVIRYRTKWLVWQEAYIDYIDGVESVYIEVDYETANLIQRHLRNLSTLFPQDSHGFQLEIGKPVTNYIRTYGYCATGEELSELAT